MSSEARRGRPTRQGGFGRSSTLIFAGGALVITALLVVAVVGGLSAKHPGGQASSAGNGKSAKAAKGAKAAKTAANVTTTTTHAEAIDQLLSKVSMSPANGSTKQPLSTVVTLRASGARLESVRVSVLPGGGKLRGALGPAGEEWHSTGKLFPGSTYTVHYVVVGTEAGPATSAATSTGVATFSAKGLGTFTTAPPASIVTASVFPSPGIAVGVGQPIVFMFSQPVDTLAAQTAVESHLSIAMSKPVPGGWHWFSSVELHFRPTSYWPVGDQVEVNGNLNGWDIGGGAWGAGVVSTAFVIGNSHISVVNLATHEMTVTDNGRVLYQNWPISAGQPRWPTQDGTHIVLDRESVVHMISSTVGIPVKSPAGYNEFVYWDVHISDSGEYVHAAPWSVPDQGFRNVSHGCVNLSPTDAEAFFHFSRVGDIVDVVDGVRPPLQGDHGVMDWSFGGGVTWTPAKVTQLRTSVTTIPVTSLPPPPGAPTGGPVPTVPPPSTTTTATPTTTTTAPPPTTTTTAATLPAPSTTPVAPTTVQPVPTTAKSVLTTAAKPALAGTRPVTTTTRVVPTTARRAPTTTRPPLTTTTKPAPTTTRPPPTTTAKPAPTTTKPAPTTTKPAPTTTKPAPTTTKPAPTTTKPAPTTTRPAPTTTSTVPTTTTSTVPPTTTSTSSTTSTTAPGGTTTTA